MGFTAIKVIHRQGMLPIHDEAVYSLLNKAFGRKTFGIVLIIAGILMLIFRGFSFTREKEVVDLGPLEINKKEKENVGWPVYAGGVAALAGVVILVTAKKK